MTALDLGSWLPLDQQIGQQESWETLLQAIAQLSTVHRHLLQRIDIEGYAYGDVAAELRIPMGTVKSQPYRARAKVRDARVAAGFIPGSPAE